LGEYDLSARRRIPTDHAVDDDRPWEDTQYFNRFGFLTAGSNDARAATGAQNTRARKPTNSGVQFISMG
jgi:hypothetical protein